MKYNEYNALQEAIPYTLPILATYLLMGAVFGIMMVNAGYSIWISFLMSTIIYAGAMQYVAVAWLAGGVPFAAIVLISLSINARQFFYAIASLRRYELGGFRKWYLIFSVTDETFAVLNLREQKKPTNKGNIAQEIYDKNTQEYKIYTQKILFYISLLNHFYWILGSVLGTLLGSSLSFIHAVEGLEFIVVATFSILLYENIRLKNNWMPICVGILSTLLYFFVDLENFLLYSLVTIVFILSLVSIQKK